MPNVSIVLTVMITVCSTTYTVAASWNLLSMYTQGDQEKPTYHVVVSSIHVCVCVCVCGYGRMCAARICYAA